MYENLLGQHMQLDVSKRGTSCARFGEGVCSMACMSPMLDWRGTWPARCILPQHVQWRGVRGGYCSDMPFERCLLITKQRPRRMTSMTRASWALVSPSVLRHLVVCQQRPWHSPKLSLRTTVQFNHLLHQHITLQPPPSSSYQISTISVRDY